MIPHLKHRAAALSAFGWTGRDAEWLALVCLHSGVFLRAQYLAFAGQPHPELGGRFVRRCGRAAVEEPWNGSELRLCRIAARPLYRALGAEHVRHRRTAQPAVLLRRLLSLDYVLERPDLPWLATEQEKVAALAAAGIPRGAMPSRLYRGALGAQRRYFAHKLPLALGGERATFVFVQAEDATASAVRTWGGQHAGLWAALAERGRAVEVVVVGRDPERLREAGHVVDGWTKRSPVPAGDAAAELASLREAVATLDREALEACGGLNAAVAHCAALEKAAAASGGAPGPAVAAGRTWRSARVPS